MKKSILMAITLTGLSLTSHAQCSSTPDFYDDYSSATGWTSVDKTNHTPYVTVGSGTMNYSNVSGGREQRVVKALPFTLSNAFVSECKIRITGGNAPAHLIMSFTENNNDTWYTQTGALAECTTPFTGTVTNQDALFCYIIQPATSLSPFCCPQNSSWTVVVGHKDGTTVNNNASTGISIPNANTDYYVRMQRTDYWGGIISIFSDAAMTTHIPGSPQCFTMPSTVQNLKYVQHGVSTGGNCRRNLSMTLDDLKIYNGSPCPWALTPSFTAENVVCGNGGIIVDGSASTSAPGLPISNYFWMVRACDASGNPLPGSTQWDAPYGSPAVYTIPNSASGGPITCGNYYLITLAVQNCGNNWTSTSQVVYVACAGPAYTKNISTGYDNSISGLNTPGLPDDEWVSANVSGAPYATCITHTIGGGAWALDPLGTGLWVTSAPSGSQAANQLGNLQNYWYEYTFYLPSAYSGYQLTINKFAADDYAEMYLNSAPTPFLTLNPAAPSTNYTVGITSPVTVSLSSGWNTLKVYTENYIRYTGMLVVGKVTGSCDLSETDPGGGQSLSQNNGIQEMEQRSFSLVPNPATGKTHLLFDRKESTVSAGVITIYNASGRVVKTIREKELPSKYDLNLEGLASGIYLVEVQCNEERYNQRLIIE